MTRVGIFAAAIVACGCGATTSAHGAASTIDPAAFLLEVGGQSSAVLHRPERSIDELETARRDAHGTDRRQIVRDLVVANLFAAEGAEAREARRIRHHTEELADAAVQGSRDDTLNAEMAFVKLWMSWRADAPNAEQRAERFTEHYTQSHDLVALAWMIRGEIALAHQHYDDALTAFRFGLGDLDHPLYGFALLRTADSYRQMGRADDATQALSEVEQLGCAPSPSPFVLRLAVAAAGERGTGVRRDPDGTERPSSCAQHPPSGSEQEEEGWHPSE